MRNQYRFMKPPAPVKRAHLDNLALVPGNLLPALKRYQARVHDLYSGELLVVLPDQASKQRTTVTLVAKFLREAGHQVRIVREDEFNCEAGSAR